MDVSNTNIHCYSGCLTSAKISVIGASDVCHDGSIMKLFGIVAGVFCGLVMIGTMWFTYYRHSIYLMLFSTSYSNASMVALSFFKVILIIAISLSLDNWWTYGSYSSVSRNNGIIESCSNTDETECFSFCPGNIETVVISISDITGANQNTTATNCIANLPASCAYKYWLIFKLVPMMAHLFVLLLQCWCLYRYKEFTPQELQFSIISKYLYSNDYAIDLVDKLSFKSMMQKLLCRPFYSIFPFMELSIAVYVWGELRYPSTSCGSIPPLSAYYYPILMTIFDMSKFNLYHAGSRVARGEYCSAIGAAINLESFFFYSLLAFILGLHFMYNYVKLLVHTLYSMLNLTQAMNRSGGYNSGAGIVIENSNAVDESTKRDSYRDTELTSEDITTNTMHSKEEDTIA